MRVTANVIHRTFHIKYQEGTGTGFVIDHGSKEYLVTARHVVEGIESGESIQVFQDNQWKNLVVRVVGIGKDNIDIAVLAYSVSLSPLIPLVASKSGVAFGQSVAFLGYPFGWDSGYEGMNRGIPFPFVKAGILSAVLPGDVSLLILDAHGNKGFSGGPVVFYPDEQRTNGLRVAGIIAGYPTPEQSWQPIVDHEGKEIMDQKGKPIGYIRENPGIVVATDIKHALELIDANPIGLPLPAGKD